MRLLARLLRLILPDAGKVALAASLGIATVASGVGLMGTAAYLIASAALHPSIAELQVAIVGVRFFGLSRGVFRYLERLASHRLTLDLLGRFRVWFYQALEPLAPAQTLEFESSDLLTRAVNDVETLQGLYLRVVAPPIVALVVALGTTGFIATYAPLPAAGFILVYSFACIGIPVAVSRIDRPVGLRLAVARAGLAAAVVDGVQGMADLLANGRAEAHKKSLNALSLRLVRDRVRVARVEAFASAATTFLTHLAVFVVLVVSIPLVRQGLLDGVGLAVISLVAMAAFEAVHPLPIAVGHLVEQLAAARRVFAVIDSTPAVAEARNTVCFSAVSDRALLEVRDLSFTYPGASRPALDGLDLELPVGGRLAVVGPSGAGKSTLAMLLLRFWDPSFGKIVLAGEELRRYGLDDLRQQIAVLSQTTDLFTGTIRENLLLAAPDANQEELEEVAEDAEILESIRGFPDGWNTWIGEHGLRLSEGQRRRVAIARVLLRDPRLLVLDEPTAGLDPVTESHLLRSLRRLTSGRTAIHITHRLIEMEEMDQILVLDRGRVIELGRHEELLGRDGLYRQLHDSQNLTLRTVV